MIVSLDDVLSACKEKIIFGDEHIKYLDWIQGHLEQRLHAVVGGGYRKSYYKVAELVVAYSQVIVYYKDEMTEEAIIEKYRAMYPRKSAFKKELNKIK